MRWLILGNSACVYCTRSESQTAAQAVWMFLALAGGCEVANLGGGREHAAAWAGNGLLMAAR